MRDKNFERELVDVATRKVLKSYEDGKMPVGDQVVVVFKDCSLLYTMESIEGEPHLRIELNPEKPIIIDGELFKVD